MSGIALRSSLASNIVQPMAWFLAIAAACCQPCLAGVLADAQLAFA